MIEVRDKLLSAFRDVKFQEEGHKYWFEGKPEKKLVSVTSIVGKLHKPFDKEGCAARQAAKWGKTKEEIIAEWDREAAFACDKGTLTHRYMEYNLSGKTFDIPLNLNRPEIVRAFQDLKPVCDAFMQNLLKTMTPVCSELQVGVYDWSLVGTIDQLFLDENGDLWIYDWKTNKKFTDSNEWENLLWPFGNWPNSSLAGYSIQLRLYQKIIEHVTGLKVKGCRLVWFSPQGERVYDCIEFTDEVDQLLKNHIETFCAQRPAPKPEFKWVHI